MSHDDIIAMAVEVGFNPKMNHSLRRTLIQFAGLIQTATLEATAIAAAPQDATDWEAVSADQAMTIAMLTVDYQQLQALVTSQGVRMMEQEEWQKDAAKYRWLLRLFVYLGDSPAETLDAAIVKTMAKMPLEDV